MNVLPARFRTAKYLVSRSSHLAALLGLWVALLLSPARAARAQDGEGATEGQTQPPARPFILPFAELPGPDTWLLGQTYGNTVGAYFNRNTTYRYSQGIHFGIDLSAPCGTEIVAIADGVVALVDARAYGSLPHNLIIDHPQLGYASLYGHLLEKPDLQPGQQVRAGQVLALSGDPDETCTGRPHLHLEIRDYPGRAWKYNPIPLIDADWDNLALAGSFRSGFERDLADPRKWQQLDDQPPAVSGGAIINNFANPWPRAR
jgi:murein DD-endopeptidase MepM/ murein hydrolase activator NlpD